MGGIVWLFKKSDTLIAENEKSAKTELKEQIIQLSTLESFVALFLLDPSNANRDKMFEKFGACSFFMTDKLKRKLEDAMANPVQDEIKRFQVELQAYIEKRRSYVDRDENLIHIESAPTRAMLVARHVGRSVLSIAFIAGVLLFVALFLGSLYLKLMHTSSMFMKINLLIAFAGGILAIVNIYVILQTPIDKILKTVYIIVVLSFASIMCIIYFTYLAIPVLVVQFYGLWRLMLSINRGTAT